MYFFIRLMIIDKERVLRMNLDIKRIELEERDNLERLLQLYLHDLSLYFPIPFNSNKCLYEYDLNKYFEDNYAYFIKLENNILGFILVDNNGNKNYEISEMFVLNNYKGNKVGELAVKKIFDMYKGSWTIKVVPSSPLAESFWIKTIKNYTNDNFRLEHTGKYNRAILYFNND